MSLNVRHLLLLLSLFALVLFNGRTLGLFPKANNSRIENSPAARAVNGPDAWYEGPDGYEAADGLHRTQHDAIIVYFYTDWCPYCKKLDRDLLPAPEMREFLKSVIKVRINPENGERELALARKFDVHGFPSVFVVPRESDMQTKVYPFKRIGGTFQALSPADFAQACKRAGAL